MSGLMLMAITSLLAIFGRSKYDEYRKRFKKRSVCVTCLATETEEIIPHF